MRFSRKLAASAVSVLAVIAMVTPSATAADLSCDDPSTLQAAVTEAQNALADARTQFHLANRPLGRLVAAKRAQARAELSRSRTTMRALVKEVHSADADDRATARAGLRAERRDLAEARSLLTSKRELLAAIKADRRTALYAVAAARTNLITATELSGSCGGTDTTDTTDEDTDTDTTP